LYNLTIHQSMEVGMKRGLNRKNINSHDGHVLFSLSRNNTYSPLRISTFVAVLGALLTLSSPAGAQDLKSDLTAVGRSEIPAVTLTEDGANYGPILNAEATVAMLARHAAEEHEKAMPSGSEAGPQNPPPEAAPAAGATGADVGSPRYRNEQRQLARMELMFQLLNAADVATTVSCVERRTCIENNPLYGGPRPNWTRVAGIKAGVGVIHYLVYRTLAKSEPRLAKIFELTTITVQGAAVLWNMTIALK